MKLFCVKQKCIKKEISYLIYDDNNKLIMKAKGNKSIEFLNRFLGGILSIGYNIKIMDLYDKEIMKLRRLSTFIFSKFKLFEGENELARINQTKALTKPIVDILFKGEKYNLEGGIMGREMIVKKGAKVIAKINKEGIKLEDSYKVVVFEEDEYIVFICMAIVVDCLYFE